MIFKEAYIDKLICHHFSIDRQKCIVNHKEIDMTQYMRNIIPIEDMYLFGKKDSHNLT